MQPGWRVRRGWLGPVWRRNSAEVGRFSSPYGSRQRTPGNFPVNDLGDRKLICCLQHPYCVSRKAGGLLFCAHVTVGDRRCLRVPVGAQTQRGSRPRRLPPCEGEPGWSDYLRCWSTGATELGVGCPLVSGVVRDLRLGCGPDVARRSSRRSRFGAFLVVGSGMEDSGRERRASMLNRIKAMWARLWRRGRRTS